MSDTSRPRTVARALAAGLLAAGGGLASGAAAAADAGPGPLTVASQGSFFVGGRNVASETLSTLPAYAPSGTITVDQVYVRYQIPVAPVRAPLVLVHGCCLTGKTWETTPDGRMGWDEFFVRRGFPTYVIDQAGRGRSAVNPSPINAVKLGRAGADTLPPVFSAGQEPAWAIFRFGPEYPKVFPGMQFPLEAQGEFWKQMVADWSATLPTPNPTVPALSELAKRLKGAVLVSHSQSGIYPFQTAALDRSGVRAIVAVEPAACPDPAKDDLAPYKGLPILVLFGDYVDQSPRWAPRLALCRAFVAAANAAGGKAELILLPEIGIHGNSHMLMQDKNSLDIAEWLAGWLDKRVPARS
ncbi:esterase [Methylobacterium sp. NEAU 140]|uniref:esterase n=1 Tax=Methylobacterium sp. NEAU 140 TaxID=3064945 RepID=UPI0027354E73|nr:esterase [Methylobacterium sp. NEAU 140]MDP4026523.1 esterase [Methylobacterium sp. NEAU 140]